MSKSQVASIVVDPAAKIVVVKSDNPFREGTAVHKRAQVVLSAKGKPVADVLKRGARTSTVRFLVRARLVRLEKPAAKKAAPREGVAA